jgi:hypothetical protein
MELDDLTGSEQKPDFSREWAAWVTDRKADHLFHEIFCQRCGEVKAVPVYCKNRFCPICSQSRKFKIQNRLNELLKLTKPTESRTLKHLILTTKNSDYVNHGAERIVNAFKRLRQTKLWKSKEPHGAWVIEVTGSPMHWHVHIHAIIVSKYINVVDLTTEWTKLTGATHVKLVKTTQDLGIGYITKYVTKGEFNPEFIDQVALDLRDFRLFNVFGCWHNAKIAKIKLTCTCPVCKGTKWQAVNGYFIHGTNSEITAYLSDLRHRWLEPEGNQRE